MKSDFFNLLSMFSPVSDKYGVYIAEKLGISPWQPGAPLHRALFESSSSQTFPFFNSLCFFLSTAIGFENNLPKTEKYKANPEKTPPPHNY